MDTLVPAALPFSANLCWNRRPTPAFLYGAPHKRRWLGTLARLSLYLRGRRRREAILMLLSLDVFKLKQTNV